MSSAPTDQARATDPAGSPDAGRPAEQVEVLVVGGGPAGLAAAAGAARAGADVLVLERSAAIGEPVRTSGGSFIPLLRRLGIPASCWTPVRTVHLVGPRERVRWHSRRAVFCVLDVRRTYQHLAARAVDAGARIELHAHVNAVCTDATGRVTGVRVRRPGRGETTIDARIVVDASGHGATVVRDRLPRTGPLRQAVGLETEVYAPDYDADEAYLVVDGRMDAGYGWAFPCGEGRVRLGVGLIRPESQGELRPLLDLLPSMVPGLADALARSGPIEAHSGVMPIVDPAEQPMTGDGWLAVGDAAGQGSTLVGEGIRYAIRAGQIAGETLAAARPDGYRAEALADYPRRWRAEYGRELEIGWAVHRRLRAFRAEDWDRALALVAGLRPRQFGQAIQGRMTPGWALGVLVTNPGLLPTVGRLLRARHAARAAR